MTNTADLQFLQHPARIPSGELQSQSGIAMMEFIVPFCFRSSY
jgi:hypothetical protein